MQPSHRLTATLVFLLLSFTSFGQQKLGIFDGHADIGTNVKPGSATYIPQDDQYLVSGAGYNIWFDHDEFHYVYKKMKGDFILYARAGFVGWKGVEEHRKIGWMVRKSLDGRSAQVNAVVHGDGLTSLQFRRTDGGTTEEIRSKLTHADVIQLERKGSIYTMRVAVFGEPFVTADIADIALGDEVYVGLFVGSHNADVVESGLFRDVRITVPAPPGFVPYREYIGSRIELLEFASGRRDIIYTSPQSLQAPNWTRDGKDLIYNSNGLIYRLGLTSDKPTVINTGTVKSNNNDHVLSFDGTMLGLSSAVDAAGGSVIYTVPTAGGIPKQVTPAGPSYLHGWSVDGKNLLFTGQRNNDFDIYSVPASGGPEKRLTTAKGLDDGPEYTPDGKYIYFNSNRTGTMQIWRMKSDGSEQEAVTNGDYHDWFPHISPDGKWIAFVSFLKEEVSADDHPFYKHVYIRVMPIAGGQPRVIAYLYGGQGTMNTPSWSPDSKRLAFISNTHN
jgi:Tol biopolymer transport system component